VEVRIAPLVAFLPILGGIAAQIDARIDAPAVVPRGFEALRAAMRRTGWSTSVYDAVRDGGWALIIFGLIIGLVVHVRDKKRTVAKRSPT
jgi:hypothetical protein